MRIEIKLMVDVEMDTESDGVHVEVDRQEVSGAIMDMLDQVSGMMADDMVEAITEGTGFCVKGLTLTRVEVPHA